MEYLGQIFFLLLITYLFVHFKKPKIRFLFYGYFFFILILLIQIPIKVAENFLLKYINFTSLPIILLNILSITLFELTKYFSLKRFVKSKSFKNEILFGIGWVSLESLSIFTTLFYSLAFTLLGVHLKYTNLTAGQNSINFLFFLLFNLAITILIIISIIKKKIKYLIISISLSYLTFFAIIYLTGLYKYLFFIITIIYSTFIIYGYKYLR